MSFIRGTYILSRISDTFVICLGIRNHIFKGHFKELLRAPSLKRMHITLAVRIQDAARARAADGSRRGTLRLPKRAATSLREFRD